LRRHNPPYLRSPEQEGDVAPVELTCSIGGRLFAFEHTGIEPFERHIAIEAKRHFQPLRDALKTADPLAPLFFDMKSSILHANHGFFITSDNPVVREVDPRTRHPFYGDGGFTNKTVEVTFPLSREVLLLINVLEHRAAERIP